MAHDSCSEHGQIFRRIQCLYSKTYEPNLIISPPVYLMIVMIEQLLRTKTMRLNLNCNKREVIIIMMSTSIVVRLGYNFPVTHWRSDLNFFGQITRITVKMLFKLSGVASEASNLDMLHDWPPKIVIGDVPLAHLDTISDPEDREWTECIWTNTRPYCSRNWVSNTNYFHFHKSSN